MVDTCIDSRDEFNSCNIGQTRLLLLVLRVCPTSVNDAVRANTFGYYRALVPISSTINSMISIAEKVVEIQ